MAAAAGGSEGLGPDAPVIPARARLSADGRTAILEPVGFIAPESDHAVIVSHRIASVRGPPVADHAGRRRPTVGRFRTGRRSAVGPAARWVGPPPGSVPTNLRWVEVHFFEPVSGDIVLLQDGIPVQAVPALAPPRYRLAEPNLSPPIGPDEPGRLGIELREPLRPGARLTLDLSAVIDAEGRVVAPIPDHRLVSACADHLPPSLDPTGVQLDPTDLELGLRGAVSEPGTLEAELSLLAGEPPCRGLPFEPAALLVRGGPGHCAAIDPCLPANCPAPDSCEPAVGSCPAALRVNPLCPARRWAVRVRAVDWAGNTGDWTERQEVSTLPPTPRPVLTEVLAKAAPPDVRGEYVEVLNLGSAPANLTGWRLRKRRAGQGTEACTLAPMVGGPIEPGGFALLVGGSWDDRYALPAGTALYRCGAGALLGGIANDRSPALALETPEEITASSLGWLELAPRCFGTTSLERLEPRGADARANLLCAAEGSGSPGACNSVSLPRACEVIPPEG
jgi:hypothetical protein